MRLQLLGYLDANRSEIIIDKDGRYKSGLETVDTKPYDVFLAGESHAIKNYDIRFALIQYLRETASVRVLLLESGYASAAYLNIYLQTGDLKILQSYLEILPGHQPAATKNTPFGKNFINITRHRRMP